MLVLLLSENPNWYSFNISIEWLALCTHTHTCTICVHTREKVDETKERQGGWAEDEPAKIYELSVTLIRLFSGTFHHQKAGTDQQLVSQLNRLPWLRRWFNFPVITMMKANWLKNHQSRLSFVVILAVFSSFWKLCMSVLTMAGCILGVIPVKKTNDHTGNIRTVWGSTRVFQ